MTCEEFLSKHKRVFVALQHYGDWGYFYAYETGGMAFTSQRSFRVIFNRDRPFRITVRSGTQRVTKRYRHEDSVLAALARIHSGKDP